jgi:hypothetical protein
MQRTCCQRAEVAVTLGDLRRVAVATRRRDLRERRATTDPACTSSRLTGVDDSCCPTAVVAPPGGSMRRALVVDALPAEHLRRRPHAELAELAEERSAPVLTERAS